MITYEPMPAMDKSPTSMVWMPGPEGWKCFKGPRFDRYIVVVEGTLAAIVEELQALRLSCPQQPAEGWHTAYSLCELHDSKDGSITPAAGRTPSGLLVLFRLAVTDEENPFEPERSFEPPPEGEPLPPLGSVVRKYIQAYLEEKKI